MEGFCFCDLNMSKSHWSFRVFAVEPQDGQIRFSKCLVIHKSYHLKIMKIKVVRNFLIFQLSQITNVF